MNLQELLQEAEIKKQYDEVARFRAGELTYSVRMRKARVSIKSTDENGETDEKIITSVVPDIGITLLSSRKREVEKSPLDPSVNRMRGAVRREFSNTFDKMYSKLTPEEIEKYHAEKAMAKAMDVVTSYFKKYKPEFVTVFAYKDDKEKRERMYTVALKRLGYNLIIKEDDGLLLFSNKPSTYSKIGSTYEDLPKGKNISNASTLKRNIKMIASFL